MNNQKIYWPIEMMFSETETSFEIPHNGDWLKIQKSDAVFGKDPHGNDCFQINDSVIERAALLQI